MDRTDRGGNAWTAQERGAGKATEDEGDASVPTPCLTSPAPTGPKPLGDIIYLIPTLAHLLNSCDVQEKH
jgi:hypothetical protein